MPVTAVGKIFKPRLREDAAEHAARAALKAVGLSSVGIQARTENARGLVVRVAGLREPSRAAALAALEPFSFVVEAD